MKKHTPRLLPVAVLLEMRQERVRPKHWRGRRGRDQRPSLVQYEYAKKWNGTMPHMVPPNNAPMLLQIPSR